MHEIFYNSPLALIVISSVSVGLGAVAAIFILVDIILRRGWQSMMPIMIPVYMINALYLWPITLWSYSKYGRPSVPRSTVMGAKHHMHHDHDHHQHQQQQPEEQNRRSNDPPDPHSVAQALQMHPNDCDRHKKLSITGSRSDELRDVENTK